MPNYEEIVALVEHLSSKRDPYNHHAPRVADLVVKMGQALELAASEIEMLRIGAHLHDMGKLLVRDDILNVPRKLTKAEMAMIRIHAPEGFKIARQLGYDPIIQDVILHHHENWDGTGYPDRLKGAQISLHARTVHICDTFDAMTSQRPYRKALSFENVRVQMEMQSGSMFDPNLLNMFFKKVVREA